MIKERITKKLGENKYVLMILQWLVKNIIRIGFVVDMIIVSLGLYAMYNNELNYGYLVRSCIILLVIITYWWIGYNLTLTKYKMKEYGRISWYILGKMGYKKGRVEFYAHMKGLEVQKILNVKAISNRYSEFLIENLTERGAYIYIWIMHRVLILMPWMWLYWIMVLIIYIKYGVKIVLNGVLDICLKKHYNIFIDKSNVRSGYSDKRESYRYVEWLIVFPVYRLMSYPLYIRSKILNSYWLDLLRIRFIGYFYITYLFFLGYNEILIYVKSNYLVLFIVIYVYFAFIFPLILYIRSPEEDKNEYIDYLYPNLENIVHAYYFWTITIRILADILICEYYPYHKFLIYTYTGKYRSVRNFTYRILKNVRGYGLYNYATRYKVGWPRFIEMPFRPDLKQIGLDKGLKYSNLWKYEKYYHIPMYIWERLFYAWDIYWMDLFELYWQEGLARYGVMFMDYEYGIYYKQVLDLYRIVLYFIFDLQRLNGVEFENESPFIKNIYKFKYEMTYSMIPIKYELLKNLRLYYEITKVCNFIISKDLLTYPISYMPRIFSRLVSTKYHEHFKPDVLVTNDLFCGYMKGIPTKEHHEMYLRHIGKKKYEIDIVEQHYPEIKVSLFDRIELDCPNYWGAIINKGLPEDIVSGKIWINKGVNNEEVMAYLASVTEIKEYKRFIQEDYVKAMWEEYNVIAKGLKKSKSIEITKKLISEYIKQYRELDMQDFNLMYNDILLVFDNEDIVNED